MSDRADYIRGLRELADFIEEHTGLPCPTSRSLHPAFVETREELATHARTPGLRWEKNPSDNYFCLAVRFAGGHAYEVYTERHRVCRRVVVGERLEPAVPEHMVDVVEWVCTDPLLS